MPLLSAPASRQSCHAGNSDRLLASWLPEAPASFHKRVCFPGLTNRLVCMQIEDDATSTPALWQREHPGEARSFLGAQMPAKKVEECSQAEILSRLSCLLCLSIALGTTRSRPRVCSCKDPVKACAALPGLFSRSERLAGARSAGHSGFAAQDGAVESWAPTLLSTPGKVLCMSMILGCFGNRGSGCTGASSAAAGQSLRLWPVPAHLPGLLRLPAPGAAQLQPAGKPEGYARDT